MAEKKASDPMDEGTVLLDEIRDNPIEMALKLAFLDWAGDHPEWVQGVVDVAVDYIPSLVMEGVDLTSRKRESEENYLRRREQARAYFRTENAAKRRGIPMALAWFASRGRRKTPDHRSNSLQYARGVSKYYEGHVKDPYVAEGEVIAAGLFLRFPWERNVPYGQRHWRFGPDNRIAFGVSRVTPERKLVVDTRRAERWAREGRIYG